MKKKQKKTKKTKKNAKQENCIIPFNRYGYLCFIVLQNIFICFIELLIVCYTCIYSLFDMLDKLPYL